MFFFCRLVIYSRYKEEKIKNIYNSNNNNTCLPTVPRYAAAAVAPRVFGEKKHRTAQTIIKTHTRVKGQTWRVIRVVLGSHFYARSCTTVAANDHRNVCRRSSSPPPSTDSLRARVSPVGSLPVTFLRCARCVFPSLFSLSSRRFRDSYFIHHLPAPLCVREFNDVLFFFGCAFPKFNFLIFRVCGFRRIISDRAINLSVCGLRTRCACASSCSVRKRPSLTTMDTYLTRWLSTRFLRSGIHQVREVVRRNVLWKNPFFEYEKTRRLRDKTIILTPLSSSLMTQSAVVGWIAVIIREADFDRKKPVTCEWLKKGRPVHRRRVHAACITCIIRWLRPSIRSPNT